MEEWLQIEHMCRHRCLDIMGIKIPPPAVHPLYEEYMECVKACTRSVARQLQEYYYGYV